MSADATCKHCGKHREDHHDFEPEMPPGCVCDPGTWDGGSARPACERFEGDADQYCETCEHDAACHVKEATDVC